MNNSLISKYIPLNTIVHNLDPRAKIFFVIWYLVDVFIAYNVLEFFILILMLLAIVILSKTSPAFLINSVKAISILILFTSLIHLVFNKKGECTVKNKQKISEEEFQNLIGFGGFMWVSTHIVLENGHLDTQDYYRSLLGHSPINYYFKNGKCHTIMFSSANGKTVSYEYDYKYDAKINRLIIKDFAYMDIIALSEGSMEILQPMGFFPNGKPRYAYSIYRRADDAEISSILMRSGLLKPTINLDELTEEEK